MGSPYPGFYYGMTNRFAYKNISLSLSLQGTQGNEIYNNSSGAGNSTRARVRVYAFNNSYWKSEQDPGDGNTPRPNDAPTGGVRLPSQRFLDNGSYMRLPDHHKSQFLGNRDLFGDYLKALNKKGIRVVARIETNFLHKDIFKQRPEWFERNEDGSPRAHSETPWVYRSCLFSDYSNYQVPKL